MSDQLFKRANEIFSAVVDAAEDERSALLDQLCGDDETARAEVESLLAYHEDDTGPLSDNTAVELIHTAEPKPWVGRRLGPWEVDGLLGRGGMGTVYSAHRADGAFEQKVAVKTLTLGVLDRDGVERFERERRILASLKHPNIAHVLDGGATDEGLPYLVMEYVAGVPIDTFCETEGLSVEARVDLFREVCAAVEHAHGRLILHRDIKPTNVLITADGQPKLLDFGIAKTLSGSAEEAITRVGQARLTPEYASPEQFQGEPLSTSTDVYQLGVLLYRLLAGRPPFKQEGRYVDLMTEVLERVPQMPSAVLVDANVKISSDLDKIVLMALRKEPDRRYRSAADFSDDLLAFLRGLPVRAHSGSRRYRVGKFVRRNRVAVASAGLVALSLVGGLAATLNQTGRAQREAATSKAINRFMQETLTSADPYRLGADVSLQEVLRASAGTLDTAFASDPEVRAGLLGAIGRTYVSLGLQEQGMAVLDSALASYDRLGERFSREAYAVDIVWVAGATGLGRLDEVLARTKTSVAGFEAAMGPSDSTVLVLRISRGIPGVIEGSPDEAIDELEEVLARARASFGPDHPITLRAAATLGLALALGSSRVDEAGDLLLHAAAGLHARGFQPDELVSLGYAIDGLTRVGETDEAERIARDLIKAAEESWGAGHVSTILPRQQLALALGQSRSIEESLEVLGGTLADATRLLGEDDYQRVLVQSDYSLALARVGRSTEAIPLQRQAVDFFRSQVGDQAQITLLTMQNLAWMLAQVGDFAESRELLEEAVALSQPVAGIVYYTAVTNLGWVTSLAGDHETALEVLEAPLGEARAKLSPAGSTLVSLLVTRARILLQSGRIEDAERAYLEIHANYVTARGEGSGHVDIQWAIRQLVGFYESIGREADAMRWEQELDASG